MSQFSGVYDPDRRSWFLLRDGAPITPARSQALRNHSPTGFAWGYGGSGPAQTSLALLLELGLSDEDALAMCQAFKWAFVAALPLDKSWTRSEGTLLSLVAVLREAKQ